MNILYHHRTRGIGAEGIHIREILRAFQRNGHKVKMVSLTNRNLILDVEKKNENKDKYNPLKEYKIKIFRKIFALLYSIPGYIVLKKAMHKDIDFIYERYSLYNMAGVKIAKKYKIPLILEVNAPYAHEIEEHERPLFPNLAKKIEINIFKKAHRIIVVSKSLKDYLIKLGIDEKAIIVQHNGVDRTKFSPKVSGEGVRKELKLENKTVIGFIGGLEKHHGLENLLEAMAKMNTNMVLMLVGNGSLGSLLESKAKELEVEIVLTGRIPHEDAPKYISAMDICVKPDANSYCSPMKIFEYMAMKKPIIAGDTNSVREILDDSRAMLVEPTPNGIAQAIKLLTEQKPLRNKIATNGYNHLKANYSWDKNIKEIINEIQENKKMV